MTPTKNSIRENSSNHFMSGLVLGSVLGGVALYLFGTQSGRTVLRELIDLSEQLEDEIKHFDLSQFDDSKKKNKTNSHSSNLQTVLEKIQQVLPSEETVQKYFAKDGKLLKS